MLGGKISNQDEEEVEDELLALEAELKKQEPLPEVPTNELPAPQKTTPEPQPVDEARQKEPERQAMLAA